MRLAKSREPGLPVFLLGHSAGGVVSCVYTLEHQPSSPDSSARVSPTRYRRPISPLAVIKGLSYIAPRLPVLKLKNKDFSRDPKVVQALNADPFIANEVQPAATVAALVRAGEGGGPRFLRT